MIRAAVCAIAALLAACAPDAADAPDDSDPLAVIQALYAEPVLWFDTDAEWSAYFAPDLWPAIVEDGSDPDLVGNVNFDYRTDSQDGTVSDLRFDSLSRAPGLVAASLAVEGDPRTILWTLCRTPEGGWRIFDAARQDGDAPWSLRGLLDLPPATPSGEPVACA